MKLKLTICIMFFASFLLMFFPNIIIDSTFKTGVIVVNDLTKYSAFVNTCNILSIVCFFVGFLLLILMWIYPFLERFKK